MSPGILLSIVMGCTWSALRGDWSILPYLPCTPAEKTCTEWLSAGKSGDMIIWPQRCVVSGMANKRSICRRVTNYTREKIKQSLRITNYTVFTLVDYFSFLFTSSFLSLFSSLNHAGQKFTLPTANRIAWSDQRFIICNLITKFLIINIRNIRNLRNIWIFSLCKSLRVLSSRSSKRRCP